MKRLLLLILSFGLFAGAAYAHNGMVHVMGTVTAMTDTSISVKAMDGKVQTVALTTGTKYLRGETSVTLKDIKIGDHIVIHATGKPDHLVAAEVKLGTMKNMSGMKMDESSQAAAH
jgi:hypothetical protein